jgi:mercuric ion binding protein
MCAAVWLALSMVVVAASAQSTLPPRYRFQVDGLACPFCAYGIEKQLSRMEGVRDIDMDIETGTVVITMTEGSMLDESTARKAVEAAGFRLRDFQQVEGGS